MEIFLFVLEVIGGLVLVVALSTAIFCYDVIGRWLLGLGSVKDDLARIEDQARGMQAEVVFNKQDILALQTKVRKLEAKRTRSRR